MNVPAPCMLFALWAALTSILGYLCTTLPSVVLASAPSALVLVRLQPTIHPDYVHVLEMRKEVK
jgi:hypothetical protein